MNCLNFQQLKYSLLDKFHRLAIKKRCDQLQNRTVDSSKI